LFNFIAFFTYGHCNQLRFVQLNNKVLIDYWSHYNVGPAGLHHSANLRIGLQTYTEPVALKYGILDTKYTYVDMAYGYFFTVRVQTPATSRPTAG